VRKLTYKARRPVSEREWLDKAVAMEQYLILRLFAMSELVYSNEGLIDIIETITKGNIRIASLFRYMRERQQGSGDLNEFIFSIVQRARDDLGITELEKNN
jgi:hypothetical protein